MEAELNRRNSTKTKVISMSLYQQSTLYIYIVQLKEKMLQNQNTHRDYKPIVNDTITAIINYSVESKELKALLKALSPTSKNYQEAILRS